MLNFHIIIAIWSISGLLATTKQIKEISNLTNQMWFSVVCTLINNDACHHSGQNVVDSLGCAL